MGAARLVRLVCVACALGAAGPGVRAADPHAAHQHESEQSPGYARRLASYRLPETALVRSDGARVSFTKEIDDGRPVVLNFIYTTCTAVCPVLSQSFAGLQRNLGAERDKVRMVSISIDPEQDSPERLAQYARRFEAGRQWSFYTGSLKSSITLQKAFQAYFGDKMHHRPMTFMRVAPGEPWVRIEGFATPEELLKEYLQLVAGR
jgi:protein SCO1/2